jgi:hypothetical protein
VNIFETGFQDPIGRSLARGFVQVNSSEKAALSQRPGDRRRAL